MCVISSIQGLMDYLPDIVRMTVACFLTDQKFYADKIKEHYIMKNRSYKSYLISQLRSNSLENSLSEEDYYKSIKEHNAKYQKMIDFILQTV